jgi:ankyrin repeat protein
MPDLPPRPDLDQLRRQARELLRAARAGDEDAVVRIRAVSPSPTLTSARLVIAREYGFPSWGRLKTEVEARTRGLAEQSAAFCEASIRDWTGRAAWMLAATPEIAGHGLATAVVLGDTARVREAIEHDPAATRPDTRTGWTPLHAVCASRWHHLDPARAEGLTAVARLLLERGAVPGDHDLYLACFGGDNHESLRLLLAASPDVSQTTALSAPVSTGDTTAVRMLLEAGADPNWPLPRDHGEPSWPALYAAISSACPAELVELLLEHGGDPGAAGPDGRSPYRLATSLGRADLTALLRRHGARDDATSTERFLSACLRADRATAHRLLAGDPGLPARLTEAERGAIVTAAERGDTGAVWLMLDLGFDIDARGGDDGGTALHAAAYSGSLGTVRLLLDRGVGLEARDTTWDSTPLVWAMVGSGERSRGNFRPDWAGTVRILLEAGASTTGIELSPDDAKAPSAEVADILRAAGVPDRDTTARPAQ